MEEQTHSVPTLCRMGCGFFGNSATEGMCSKCFRDYQRRKQDTAKQQRSSSHSTQQPQVDHISQLSTNSSATVDKDDSACAMEGEVQATPLSDLPASSLTITTVPDTHVLPKTPRKNRCHVCRKKLGLTGFHCRCGEQFCSLHRYADKHGCTFDYKTVGREELERRHPKVVAAKIQKL